MVAAPGPKGLTLCLTLCAVCVLSVEIKYLLRRGRMFGWLISTLPWWGPVSISKAVCSPTQF